MRQLIGQGRPRMRRQGWPALPLPLRGAGFRAAGCALAASFVLAAAPAVARAGGHVRVSIGRLSQQRLLSARSVSVRVRGAAAPGAVLRVYDVETTGGIVGAASRVSPSMRVGAPGTFTLPLTRSALAALRTCAQRRLSVHLDANGQVEAVAMRKIAIDAPHCERYFAPRSFWNTPLAPNAPLDPASSAISATLNSVVNAEEAIHFGPSINVTRYSVPVYTVGLAQPTQPVILDRTEPFALTLKAILAVGVPIPAGAQPAAGNDEHLVVVQPAADRMWEFWHMHQVNGVWHADWGGFMPHMSTNAGVFVDRAGAPWGATATSLPLLGGLITLSDLRRGVIHHMLAFAMPGARAKYWSLPAQRTDGSNKNPDAVPEGAIFRLPAGLDIAALHLPPLVAMMAAAVQKYGMILRDTSASVDFYGEDPTSSGFGVWPRTLGPGLPEALIAKFPWAQLELTKMSLRTYG